MKHEVLEAVEVVAPLVVKEVEFTAAPSLNAAIEAAQAEEKRRQEALRREQEMSNRHQQCDCTSYRSDFLYR